MSYFLPIVAIASVAMAAFFAACAENMSARQLGGVWAAIVLVVMCAAASVTAAYFWGAQS